MDIISLNIYKKNADGMEECIKEYTERDVRWGVIEDALELEAQQQEQKLEMQEKLQNCPENERKDIALKLKSQFNRQQFKDFTKVVQTIFPDLTEEHRKLAYRDDIMNCFKQVLSLGREIVDEADENIKNGEAEGSK